MAEDVSTRGDIWRINLDPTVGSEIKKTRPAVVINSPIFDKLPVRVVVPLTTWQTKFANQLNKVHVPSSPQNGLDHDSAADVVQLRCVSVERFVSRIGVLEAAVVEEIAAGIAIVVDYQP